MIDADVGCSRFATPRPRGDLGVTGSGRLHPGR
jgi:hypothetical protein